MAKLAFKRIFEPAEKLVHIDAPPGMDAVTLCGITDWLGVKPGFRTTEPVTCQPCRWIAEYCQGCRRLPALSAADGSKT